MNTTDLLQLSQKIEQGFSQFGYPLTFSRDSITHNPAEAIEDGLRHLNAIGAISDEELTEHFGNYQWGEQSLSEVVSSPDGKKQLNVLLRNLDFWHHCYVERYAEDHDGNAEVDK